jgi:hypothetical protein
MARSMARDKKVLRNLDDEIYRIAPKTYAKGAEGRDAREEYGRINREKRFEKNQMNRMAKGGSVKGKQTKADKLDERLGNIDGKESTKSQSYSSRRNESNAIKGKGKMRTVQARGCGLAKRGCGPTYLC